MKKQFEFDYPITNTLVTPWQHFTDLHIFCTLTLNKVEDKLSVDIDNVAYFAGNDCVGSNLKSFIKITSPELWADITIASLNQAEYVLSNKKKAERL